MLKKWLRGWLGANDSDKAILETIKTLMGLSKSHNALHDYMMNFEKGTVDSIIRNREYSDKLQQEIERTRQLVLQIGHKLGMTNQAGKDNEKAD